MTTITIPTIAPTPTPRTISAQSAANPTQYNIMYANPYYTPIVLPADYQPHMHNTLHGYTQYPLYGQQSGMSYTTSPLVPPPHNSHPPSQLSLHMPTPKHPPHSDEAQGQIALNPLVHHNLPKPLHMSHSQFTHEELVAHTQVLEGAMAEIERAKLEQYYAASTATALDYGSNSATALDYGSNTATALGSVAPILSGSTLSQPPFQPPFQPLSQPLSTSIELGQASVPVFVPELPNEANNNTLTSPQELPSLQISSLLSIKQTPSDTQLKLNAPNLVNIEREPQQAQEQMQANGAEHTVSTDDADRTQPLQHYNDGLVLSSLTQSDPAAEPERAEHAADATSATIASATTTTTCSATSAATSYDVATVTAVAMDGQTNANANEMHTQADTTTAATPTATT